MKNFLQSVPALEWVVGEEIERVDLVNWQEQALRRKDEKNEAGRSTCRGAL